MSVKVAVRSRPLSAKENNDGTSIIIRMNGKQVTVMECSEGSGGSFLFDAALWTTGARFSDSSNPEASQKTVYETVGTELLQHTMTGYNGCIFAYGQTGSGKTYCMMGDELDPGLVPRIAQKLFESTAQLRGEDVETCVEVSYYEIYNEKVRCLLRPGYDESVLRVREHPKFGPFIEGLAKFVVGNQTEFLRLMNDGNKVRTTASTAINQTSSRSHAVFAITLTQKRKRGPLYTTTTSRLNLVDLAGSERASKSMATGRRLAEGANINKSLTCLGNVISALAEVEETHRARHIPYRDSTLTWILKENLGGNSKTVMLATISPSSAQYEETMSTLRYAERAKKIVNKAVINESNNNEVVAALQKEIALLKKQLESASLSERSRLQEALHASEAIKREFDTTLEEKLAETRLMMQEKERHMRELESKLDAQETEIESLRHANAEKERRIKELLDQVKQMTSRSVNSVSADGGPSGGAHTAGSGDAMKRILEEVATLEQEQMAQASVIRRRHTIYGDGSDLLSASMRGTHAVEADAASVGRPTAISAAFSSSAGIGVPPLPPLPQRVSDTATEGVAAAPAALRRDSKLTQQFVSSVSAVSGDRGQALWSSPPLPGSTMDVDDDDLEVDERLLLDEDEAEAVGGGKRDPHQNTSGVTKPPAADSDIELTSESSQLGDDGPSEHDVVISPEDGRLAALPGDVADRQTHDNHRSSISDQDDDDSLIVEENVILPDDEYADAPPVIGGADGDSGTHTSVPLVLRQDDLPRESPSRGGSGPTTPGKVRYNLTMGSDGQFVASPAPNRQPREQQGDTINRENSRPEIYDPSDDVSSLVVPSHAIPNSRFLHEPFKVVKITGTGAATAAQRKDRIWDVDCLQRRFSNYDMKGHKSFDLPARNLYRVERDPKHTLRLRLYFFECPAPYYLEFTSVSRRQKFFELAHVLRRNSIMWCPSLCLDGENDCLITIRGTTIDRPHNRQQPVDGATDLMVARMPYEVIDLWYGCFSLEHQELPDDAGIFSGFLPKAEHEIYVIGVTNVPASLLGNDKLGQFFLSHLGPSTFYLLANSAATSKARRVNNALVILCRRSFIVRLSQIQVKEVSAVYKDDMEKGDFTAVGCAFAVNEATFGVVLVNASAVGTYAVKSRTGCIRALLASFDFGNSDVDLFSRFDYLVVSGNFGYGDEFRAGGDPLLEEIAAGNLLSNTHEMPPSEALAAAGGPMRIFYSVRDRVARMDVTMYSLSRALPSPNAFITADVFCQRCFLSVFGEYVPRIQLLFDDLIVYSERLPADVQLPQIEITGDFFANAPLCAPLAWTESSRAPQRLVASAAVIPTLYPCVNNKEFLRLQTLIFSISGTLKGHDARTNIASGTLSLKTFLRLGHYSDFEIPLYFRGCRVGHVSGRFLEAYHEKNSAELAAAGLGDESLVSIVCYYENQTRPARDCQWEPASFESTGVQPFSADDPRRELRREHFGLPDACSWRWLTDWKHDSRADDPEGWIYAGSTDGSLQLQLQDNSSARMRRRRWYRAMQAADAVALHNYLAFKEEQKRERTL